MDNGKDHDLLIQINTKLERVILDVKELKNDTIARVSVLESEKEDKSEVSRLLVEANKIHDDHESRLRSVEGEQDNFKGRYAVLAALVVIVLSGLVSWLVNVLTAPKSVQTVITTTPAPVVNTVPAR